jgi:N-acetylneuraminic acid mutarotase
MKKLHEIDFQGASIIFTSENDIVVGVLTDPNYPLSFKKSGWLSKDSFEYRKVRYNQSAVKLLGKHINRIKGIETVEGADESVSECISYNESKNGWIRWIPE